MHECREGIPKVHKWMPKSGKIVKTFGGSKVLTRPPGETGTQLSIMPELEVHMDA